MLMIELAKGVSYLHHQRVYVFVWVCLLIGLSVSTGVLKKMIYRTATFLEEVVFLTRNI